MSILQNVNTNELKRQTEIGGDKIFEKWLTLGFCAHEKVKGQKIIIDLSNLSD